MYKDTFGGCWSSLDVLLLIILKIFHAFVSIDVAMAPNNNEVQIHQFVAGKWKQVETLSEHGQRVTGIDWAPRTNRIVTCGAVSNVVYPLPMMVY